MIHYRYQLTIQRQARLRAEADSRRLARSARLHAKARTPDRSAPPSRPLARFGEMLIMAGRYLAPETEECLPGQ